MAPTMVLENAVREDLFRPLDRQDCRAALRLPLGARIIGTAGALFPTRGIETLYRAFAELADADSGIHLALAGPRPRRSGLPRRDNVHDLGILPAEQVPMLINALDVGVVCNRDSSFGRYNFPQKAREIMACGVTMVGADVGAMRDLLQGYPECLFAPEDAASLAEVIRRQLQWPTRINSPVPTWSDSAASLEDFFAELQRGLT
jgi:glycosyltransferase involved in cell wall biosynthesis